MTLHQLAADPAAGLQVGQQLLGSVGTGGAALIATTVLVLGVRGNGKLRLNGDAAFGVGFVAGTFYGAAASFWTAPASITNGIAASLTGQAGPFGQAGLGALCALTTIVVYASGLKKGKKGLLGIGAATIFAEAGGIWAIGPMLVTSVVGHFLGVA